MCILTILTQLEKRVQSMKHKGAKLLQWESQSEAQESKVIYMMQIQALIEL